VYPTLGLSRSSRLDDVFVCNRSDIYPADCVATRPGHSLAHPRTTMIRWLITSSNDTQVRNNDLRYIRTTRLEARRRLDMTNHHRINQKTCTAGVERLNLIHDLTHLYVMYNIP